MKEDGDWEKKHLFLVVLAVLMVLYLILFGRSAPARNSSGATKKQPAREAREVYQYSSEGSGRSK